MDLRRDKPLYDKKLTFQVLNDTSTEATDIGLVFRILVGSQPSSIPGQTESLYHFELTDERDPYFIYYFSITEQNFPTYKRDQSILVDFHDFPSNIIELLEFCIHKPSRGIAGGGSSAAASQALLSFVDNVSMNTDSSFMAKFNVNTGILSFIESNKFKQIKHIELPMQLGDDNAIKMYLASRLSLTLQLNQQHYEQVETLKQLLDRKNTEKEQSDRRLFEFETRRNAEMQEMIARHQQDLTEVKERQLEEKNQLENRYTQIVENLKKHIDELKNSHNDYREQSEQAKTELLKSNNHQESQISDLARQLTVTRSDRDRYEAECNEHMERLALVEKEKSDLQVDYLKLESKHKLLEQQYQDRDETLHKTGELNRSLEENKKALEHHLEFANQQQTDLQQQYQQLKEDLQASIYQFEQLKLEYDRIKENIKMKNEVIRKQEAIVLEIKQKTVDYEGLYKKESEKTQHHEKEIKRLKKELKECLARLEESAVQMKKNQAMIDVLAKEAMRSQYGYTSTSAMIPGGGTGVGASQDFASPLQTQIAPHDFEVTNFDGSLNPTSAAYSYKTPNPSFSHPQSSPTSNDFRQTAAPNTAVAKYQLSSFTTNTAITATAASFNKKSASLLSHGNFEKAETSSAITSNYFPSNTKLMQGMQSLGITEDELKVNLPELNESYDFSSSGNTSASLNKASKLSSSKYGRQSFLTARDNEISLENIDFYAIKK